MISTTNETAYASAGVFDRYDELAAAGHEQVTYCRDDASGLLAIIAVHDTARGPALGGTRFFPYASEAQALTDVLRLSQGMTFKAAAARVPLGGGKAVILGDPIASKTPDLLRAYGRFVESLGGRYITAADVGTTAEDLDVIGEETSHVVGRTAQHGGSGDSGYATALGVYHAMEAAAERLWGDTRLEGLKVGIEGAGKVGYHLAGMVTAAGASVLVADPWLEARERLATLCPEAVFVESVVDADVDVYAPCAMGGTLTPSSVPDLRARLVCGAANNQLLVSDLAEELHRREILWVPDFVANAGGLIQVWGELAGRSVQDVIKDVRDVVITVSEVLDLAERQGSTSARAARDVVDRRLAATG